MNIKIRAKPHTLLMGAVSSLELHGKAFSALENLVALVDGF